MFGLIADFLFKFLVIGNAGTGKSCILHQFIENKCTNLQVYHSDMCSWLCLLTDYVELYVNCYSAVYVILSTCNCTYRTG